MKKLNQILFITEVPDTGKWYVSFLKPEFQGGETEEISKEDAIKLGTLIQELSKNPEISIGDAPYDTNAVK